MPSEIHRAVRNFDYIKNWKGTEYRTFLLYVGIVVLKDFLPYELYMHFLQLHCAVSICYSNAYKNYIPIAKQLFDEYVENYVNLYGIHEIGSNVHNLCHITEDVSRFGNLSEISTYEFENLLGQMKNWLKRCDKPLEQISRRITEKFLIDKQYWCDESELIFHPSVKYSFKYPNDSNVECYKQIDFKRKFGDNFFLTHENEIVEFGHVIKYNNSFRIGGFPLKNNDNFFLNPVSSRYLNIFSSNLEKENSKQYQLESIKCKLICLNYKTDHVLMPMLHSLT